MSERHYDVTIRMVGAPSATHIRTQGLVVLTEAEKGVFQMSLRGVSMPDIVLACATLMKCMQRSCILAFPTLSKWSSLTMEGLPSIGQVVEHEP